MLATRTRPETRRQRPQRASRGATTLLESLEPRTLLSAIVQVIGGTTAIANGDVTPSTVDLTDFGVMSTTVNGALGFKSYTYLLRNAGDTDLALTGGTKPIRITGRNAADFIVTQFPAGSIPAGFQSGFTITFRPKAAGLRSAFVTVPTNDPIQPNFVFALQGTGLKTTNNANGLQFATMTPGVGIGSPVGTNLTVHYTGFLLNGTRFESSLDSGQPFTLALGGGQVIQGWDQGLVGIKAGETRALFIPAALAYGANARTNIPANSALIFTVTAMGAQFPQVGIFGNNNPIAFNDLIPSTTDSTFLGATTPGTATPITATFTVKLVAGASLALPKNPVVILTGKQAKSFVASGLTFANGEATFTITFFPSKPGNYSAIAHVRTSDPIFSDFTFAVSATHTPYVDLTPTLGVVNATSIVSGAGKKFNVPLRVTNLGNSAVPASLPSIANLYLRDVNTGQDFLISSTPTTAFRGLGAGKAKSLNLTMIVPAHIPNGIYQPWVSINVNSAIAETTTANNAFLSAQMFTIAQGFNNVTGAMLSSTIPALLAAAAPVSGKVTIQVRNGGNINLPAGQRVVVQVFAHDTTTGANILLATGNANTSSFAPNKATNLSLTVKLLTGLPAGIYQLYTLLTPLTPLAESTTADNLLTTNAVGIPLAITVV